MSSYIDTNLRDDSALLLCVDSDELHFTNSSPSTPFHSINNANIKSRLLTSCVEQSITDPSNSSRKLFYYSSKNHQNRFITETSNREQFTQIIQWICPEFCLELRHGLAFGSRDIWLNGQSVVSQRKLLDSGSTHSFENQTYRFTVSIGCGSKIQFIYKLSIDGQPCLPQQNL